MIGDYCSVKKVLIGKASCHARGDDLRTTYQDFFYKTLRYTDYTQIVEPEELSGATDQPTPGFLHELWHGKNFAAIAALAIERSAHSLIGAYIPLLQDAARLMQRDTKEFLTGTRIL